MRTRLPSTPWFTTRPILAATFGLASVLGLAAGCSKSPDLSSATADPKSRSSAVAQTQPHDVLRIEAVVGGIPTSYSAYFDASQLRRIAETRQPAGTGDYVFHGARLIEYKGTAPGSAAVIELRFDPQGVLVPAAAGNAAQISDSELSSIRNRAQLLRSLSLARRATETHTGRH